VDVARAEGTAAKAESVGGTAAKAASTEAKVGGLLGSLARKIGALDAAQLYLDMHAAHFAALEKVSERAAIAKDLLARVAEFEDGARTLRTAINEAAAAESGLPDYPLATSPTSSFVVTQEELAYVNEYYAAAAQIAGKAMAARVRLARIIQGWDGVLFQAGQTGDFTRDSAFKATTELDLRFHEDGAGFRAFLVNARDQAHVVANRARAKQSLAADILSKPEPSGWALPEAGPLSEEIRQARDEVVTALNFNEFSNSLDLSLGARVSANWSNYPLAATGLRTALERWRSKLSRNSNDPGDIQNEYYNLMAVEKELYFFYEIVGMLKTSVEKKTVKGGGGLLGPKLTEAIRQMNTSLYAARDYYTDAGKAILYQERMVQAHYKALVLRFRELGGSANSALVLHPDIPEDEVKTAPLDKFRINWKSSTAL
jgi:hypothetical protein